MSQIYPLRIVEESKTIMFYDYIIYLHTSWAGLIISTKQYLLHSYGVIRDMLMEDLALYRCHALTYLLSTLDLLIFFHTLYTSTSICE